MNCEGTLGWCSPCFVFFEMGGVTDRTVSMRNGPLVAWFEGSQKGRGSGFLALCSGQVQAFLEDQVVVFLFVWCWCKTVFRSSWTVGSQIILQYPSICL